MEKIVEPLGVAVLIDGKHLCSMARGVRDTNSAMKVDVMHGAFQKDQNMRAELLMRSGRR
jgi:GTP cyclohydrolase I